MNELNSPNLNSDEADLACDLKTEKAMINTIQRRVQAKNKIQKLQRLFRIPTTSVLTAGVLGFLLSVLLTSVCGDPVPTVHDEYSYLLGADTLASGRLSNPTHTHWEHFESFHVVQKPNYVSKYQPGQAAMLALGQTFGHPIIGAWLLTAICTASLVWMLIGWLPRKFFWCIVLFAVLHPGVQIVWGQSYWGGAMAMTGSALLLGSLGRIDNQMKISISVIAAIGVLLLANSRPFEGIVLVAAVGLALVWKLATSSGWSVSGFLTRIILPAVIVLAVGFGGMAQYNLGVTGSHTKMAYQLHEAEYGWTPLFVWETAGEKPDYRHPVMEKFFASDIVLTKKKFSSAGNFLKIKAQASFTMAKFYCGGTVLLAIFGLPLVWRRQRYRFALIVGIPAFLAALATPWDWPHYAAPAAPILILGFGASLIEIWKKCRKVPYLRLGMRLAIPLLHLIWFTSTYTAHESLSKFGWAVDRAEIENKLMATPDKDLVFVHYSETHNPNAEWVYNRANIDESEVVWAREMSAEKNAALIEYFAGRKIWVVEADERPASIRPLNVQPNVTSESQASPMAQR